MQPPVIEITDDYGGNVLAYVERVEDWRQEKAVVEIRGACASACTLVLGLPNDKVCVWPSAVLGFHKATGAWGTANLLHGYSGKVRAWLGRHGGLRENVVWTSNDEAGRVVWRCPES